jgi:dihydroxyacetone kinase
MPLGPDPKALIKRMVELLLNTEDEDRSFVPFRNDGSDEVVVLVNNLGGLSELELIAIIPAIKDALADKEVIVRCVISGSYLVSPKHKRL